MKRWIFTFFIGVTLLFTGCEQRESITYEDFFYIQNINTEDLKCVQSDSISVANIGNLMIPDDYSCYHTKNNLILFNKTGSVQVCFIQTNCTDTIQVEEKFNLSNKIDTEEIKGIGSIDKYDFPIDNIDATTSCCAYILTDTQGNKILIICYYESGFEEEIKEVLNNFSL